MHLESKEYLEELESQWKDGWKSHHTHPDVKALYLGCPSDQQMEGICPDGHNLETYEKGAWRAIEKHSDGYRQTRFCKEHGYARIYVTSGLHAANANYSLAPKMSDSHKA